ncbi:MAG: penicillin-insensitive murein endopeptidase [Deltaproteobacteria bacterium]|nr:penicillin-insensitive murein endopeptidase [Deltaproteobacteria bacterium]MCW5801489.1 penicillin-insensitive murein endopeptidase [Deltaproteobacteria bacterium]
MRLLVVLFAVLACPHSADAAGGKRAAKQAKPQHRVKKVTPASPKKVDVAVREDVVRKKKGIGAQSVGVPWRGELHDATRLRVKGERVVLRRPHRAFGTRTTVEHIANAIEDTLDAYPKAHVLGVGDISAESGGRISEHHSHQSGRDVDLGLFYKRKPAAYPVSFVNATEDSLACGPTFSLLWNLVKTADKDGGASVIFLDYDVQGILYRWAKAHDVSDARLAKMFQYPHGIGSPNGMVRHIRNHANHIHVRFKCSAADTDCAR